MTRIDFVLKCFLKFSEHQEIKLAENQGQMTLFITNANEQEQEEVLDDTDELLEAKYVKKFRPQWLSLQIQYHWLRYDGNKQNVLQCDSSG